MNLYREEKEAATSSSDIKEKLNFCNYILCFLQNGVSGYLPLLGISAGEYPKSIRGLFSLIGGLNIW